jgi:hypothetical protein
MSSFRIHITEMFHKRLVLKPICNQLAPVITARKSGSNKSTDGRRGRPRRDILSGPSARDSNVDTLLPVANSLPLPRITYLLSFRGHLD